MNLFEVLINVCEHQLEVNTSRCEYEMFNLIDNLAIAAFYQKLMGIIEKLKISVSIVDKPYDLGIKKRFAEITEYHYYNANYTRDLWKSLIWINTIFEEFSGLFNGQSSPVHIHWHSMDLEVSLLSGNECINFEFWVDNENMNEPAFYSYTSPSVNGSAEEVLRPASAECIDYNGTLKAMLKYNDLVRAENSKKELLEFLESSYRAGAKRAKWDLR